MVVSDRLLVALGEFLNQDLSLGLTPRLRDFGGTKDGKTLILDAEDPVEHEALDQVFEIDGEVILKFRNRDVADATQRDELSQINDALRLRAKDWINLHTNARGLGTDELAVFDFRVADGAFEQEDKFLLGRLGFSAVICGKEKNFTFEYIGGDLGSGTNLKWRALSKLDGKLYASPNIEDELLIIDLADDTVTKSSDLSPSITIQGGNSKYIDSLVYNGAIYANPNQNTSYLKIDPSQADPFVQHPRDYLGHGSEANFSPESLRGGAESGGAIYGSVYSRNVTDHPIAFISKFDIASVTKSRINIIFGTLDSNGDEVRSGGIYDLRSNWQSELGSTLKWMYDSFFGATKAENGKIFLTPHGADRIVVVDPSSDDFVTVGSDYLTGNEPYYLGSYNGNLWSKHAYWNKYSGGTFSTLNKSIYCFPRHANSILKIDTLTNSAKEIPLPSALIVSDVSFNHDSSYPVTTNKMKSYSSVLGPNGWIYSVPYEIPFLFWINPQTDEIGFRDISTELSTAGTLGHSWFSYGVTDKNSIYLAPQSSNRVLKINFEL